MYEKAAHSFKYKEECFAFFKTMILKASKN